MIQTIESVRADVPQFVPKSGTSVAALFIEVDDFAQTISAIPCGASKATRLPCPSAPPQGMRETGVVEPGGHTVIFAARYLSPISKAG